MQSTRFARGQGNLQDAWLMNSLESFRICAGALELTQPNAMGDVDRAARQWGRHNGRHIVDSVDNFDACPREYGAVDEVYMDFLDGGGRTFESHPLGTRTAIDWGR